MILLVQYESGRRSQAVVLSMTATAMRIAPKGRDTVALTSADGASWYDESGRRVTIDALIPIAGVDYSRLWADLRPRAAAAGRLPV